ncbi:MAG TPA: glycosyltransferase family 87 protein [Dehalococcoidia bacterium]|nr:glycosyltransferase family 87 protein [Dehalococcoidia bacterium]
MQMRRAVTGRRLGPPASIVGCAALAAVSLAFGLHGASEPLRTDFSALLTAGRLAPAHLSMLYSATAQMQTQAAIIGHPAGGLNAFFGPPAEALLAAPLTALPAHVSFAAFAALSGLAGVVAAFVLVRTLGLHGVMARTAVALSAFSLAAAWNYWLGQTDPLLLLAAACALAMLVRGHRFSAGLLLAVLFVKPQVIWLLPVVLLCARQWRMLAGLLLGAAGWALSSVVLTGAHGLTQWGSLMLQFGPRLGTSVGVPGLVELVTGHSGLIVAIACIPVVAVASWMALLNRDVVEVTAAGITLSAVTAPHLFPYDLVLLAVPVAVVASRAPAMAVAAALGLNLAALIDIVAFPDRAVVETAALLLVVIAALTRVAGTARRSHGGTAATPAYTWPEHEQRMGGMAPRIRPGRALEPAARGGAAPAP